MICSTGLASLVIMVVCVCVSVCVGVCGRSKQEKQFHSSFMYDHKDNNLFVLSFIFLYISLNTTPIPKMFGCFF